MRTGAIARATTGVLERCLVDGWRERLWLSVPRRGLGIEIGAGHGGSVSRYPTRSRVVVCDPSLDRVREARTRTVEGEVLYVVAAPDALPFGTGSMDWVVSCLCLCRMRAPSAAVTELRRLVRPAAPCFLLEPVRPVGWRGRIADVISVVTGAVCRWYVNHDLAHALQTSGLHVERQVRVWGHAVIVLVGRAPARDDPAPSPANDGAIRRHRVFLVAKGIAPRFPRGEGFDRPLPPLRAARRSEQTAHHRSRHVGD